MNSFVGVSGYIACPQDQAISIQSLASAGEVSISGSLGTFYDFVTVSPISNANYRFATNEAVTIAGMQSVALNYVFYRDQVSYMTQDPSRANRLMPGKWDV